MIKMATGIFFSVNNQIHQNQKIKRKSIISYSILHVAYVPGNPEKPKGEIVDINWAKVYYFLLNKI
jgi:hypothetical protein